MVLSCRLEGFENNKGSIFMICIDVQKLPVTFSNDNYLLIEREVRTCEITGRCFYVPTKTSGCQEGNVCRGMEIETND